MGTLDNTDPLIQEKVEQATKLLNLHNIDLWLIFTQEPGVRGQIIRISVGLENAETLLTDLEAGLLVI